MTRLGRLRTVAVACLLSLTAVHAIAQKPAETALGFNPEKIYDFTNVDSVNSFNGNVILTVPLGLRYQVSSVLSYQFVLTYNSMVWDWNEWIYNDHGYDETRFEALPNLRSNAGVGWRLSMGRLFGPTEPSQLGQVFTYEGPSGDEHPFYTVDAGSSASDPAVAVTDDALPLRLKRISSTERQVHFPSGEVRTYKVENSAWRLREIDDQFGNWIKILYTYAADDAQRETSWTITDSVERTQTVTFQYFESLIDTTNRGASVQKITAVGVDNTPLVYDFGYTETSIERACGDDGSINGSNPLRYTLPMLTSITLEENSARYAFEYWADGTSDASYCEQGTLKKATYPTQGTTSYKYKIYAYGGDVCTNNDILQIAGVRPSPGVGSRTVSDGATDQLWTYVQMRGPAAPMTWNTPSDPCYPMPQRAPVGPAYWSRTSVLAPADSGGKRTRTDHYFDIFGGFGAYGTPSDAFTKDPRHAAWIYSGIYGVPSETTAKGPLSVPELTANYPADVSGADSSGFRVLRTRVYSGCTADGDCTNGTLQRSVYEEPQYGGSLVPSPGYAPTPKRAPVPKSSRTVYNSDTGCSGACYTDVVGSIPDNAGHYSVTTTSSNFPNATTVTNSTSYHIWTDAELLDTRNPWILETFTDQTTTEGDAAALQQFCFDPLTGFLLRHRTLAGRSPGASDVISVFTKTTQGDPQFSSIYGGDAQSVDTGDLCTMTLPAAPQYKSESSYMTADNHYTGGIVTWSKSYDRATQTALPFKSSDRTVDRWSGMIKSVADPSGVSTSYSYKSWGNVYTVTTPAGAVTTYTYTNASGSPGSNFVPMKVDALTTSTSGSLQAQFVLDGLGRLIRQSHLGPGGNWSATETSYDGLGRKAWVSEPESTGTSAPSGALTAALKTQYTYDAFGRPLTVTTPDNSQSTYAYTGIRNTAKTATIYTGSNTQSTTTYGYDAFGRLRTVEEPAGVSSSSAPVAANVTTSYGYDAGGRLSSVEMKGANGVVQNRIFDYDGRGFLLWEAHPESGMTTYTYDALGKVLTKRQAAAGTLFDLNYTYDSAGRVTLIEGLNPQYDSSSSDPYLASQFRPIKEFTYADSNDTSVAPVDKRAGKLTKAVRYNYPPAGTPYTHDIFSSIVRVSEAYKYQDAAGRRQHRTTDIGTWDTRASTQWSSYKTIDQDIWYNDLDLPGVTAYPICIECGVPPYVPERNLTPTYSAGQVISIPDFIVSLSYWPNGMRNQLRHYNQVVDTQALDLQTADQKASLARPASLSSGLYDACLPPTIISDPQGGLITTSTPSVVLQVTTATDSSLHYQWYSKPSGSNDWTLIAGATSSSYTAAPSTTTSYYVSILNSCKGLSSRIATVTVGSCVAPSFATAGAILNTDRTVTLAATGAGTEPYAFTWYRSSDNAVVGSGARVTIGPISATTSYYAKIANTCSSTIATTGTITAVVPLSAPASLVATKTANLNQIIVTWQPVSGAGRYHVERRSRSGWIDLTSGTTYTSTLYTDNGVTAATTYAYRVWASPDATDSSKSPYSNVDLATIMNFTSVVAGTTPVSKDIMEEIRSALNAVRYAAGWSAVTWENMLGPGQTLPDPQNEITAAQVLAVRARMNEAVQALGVAIGGYTDPNPSLAIIKAAHITEIQGRAQ